MNSSSRVTNSRSASGRGAVAHAIPEASADLCCDLCGEAAAPNPGAEAASGLTICDICLEAILDASTFNARAEVGLVGKGGLR